MTRRDYRGDVAAPRPTAAWLMSIFASATLWITELLPPWMVAVQLLAFAVSFATRDNPPAFRNSPIFLNIGMLGVTTVTIRSALDGNPATISLAFFTCLAQGLQLLDARPRRSEFLLVALALFQVILGSSLSDSVLYPPLVLLFLASVTWTLLVHTLRMEAAETGDANAASEVIRSDLRRMTIVATCGCMALALVLFLILPRVTTGMLRGGIPNGLAVSGFSDRIRLGVAGRIRKDHSIVLRVESLEGELPEPAEAYWRGLAFDEFDGRDWSISTPERGLSRRPVNGIGRFGITLRADTTGPRIAQRILREPVEAGVLFASGDVVKIEGPFQHLERDSNGGLYLPEKRHHRIRYSVWSQASQSDAATLRRDHARPPLEPAPGGPRPTERYRSLPELDPRIEARAAQIVAGASNDFERALRLQENLRRHGRYSDTPPPLGDEASSPIEAFMLGDLEGHCEYFASAMVVLARTQGLPARLVNGFAGGVRNSVGGFIEVTRADAHAWVEIHFERAGWVRFDPTPPDLRLRAEAGVSLWGQLAQFGSALELWWFQSVVDFDSADQIGALRGLWHAWQNASDSIDHGSTDERKAPQGTPAWGIAFPSRSLALLVFLGAAGLIYWRHRLATSAATRPLAYQKALRLLARRGWRRDATTSARDFAARLGQQLSRDAAGAFERITEDYLAERFGKMPSPDLNAELAILEHAIGRMGLRNQADVG